MSELNREQIIKALECCSGTTCKTICPLSNVAEINCGQLLINESLALIKELTEENERLQDLIKETQQYNEAWVADNGKLRKAMKTTKADAVRKFTEYLKEQSFNCDPGNGFSFDAIDVDELDDYVKEFLEKNE